jgi:ATP-binding cassette, subfamily C (CFTR/MRP), member 1
MYHVHNRVRNCTPIPNSPKSDNWALSHRLNTIMESDRILVLDNGMVAELDTPQNLLADKGSIFYSLAAEAGLLDGSNST